MISARHHHPGHATSGINNMEALTDQPGDLKTRIQAPDVINSRESREEYELLRQYLQWHIHGQDKAISEKINPRIKGPN